MYDALIDKSRNYRKTPYNKSFALFLIFRAAQQKQFFPFLCEKFIHYIVANELDADENIFSASNSPEETYNTISIIADSFSIHSNQEEDFNIFLYDNRETVQTINESTDDRKIIELIDNWCEYFSKVDLYRLYSFYYRLLASGLINKPLNDLTVNEVKIFTMLYRFYCSFPSKIKKKRIIEYFKEMSMEAEIDEEFRQKIIQLITNEKPATLQVYKRLLNKNGAFYRDIFDTFKDYDEDLLLVEFNQGRKQTTWSN